MFCLCFSWKTRGVIVKLQSLDNQKSSRHLKCSHYHLQPLPYTVYPPTPIRLRQFIPEWILISHIPLLAEVSWCQPSTGNCNLQQMLCRQPKGSWTNMETPVFTSLWVKRAAAGSSAQVHHPLECWLPFLTRTQEPGTHSSAPWARHCWASSGDLIWVSHHLAPEPSTALTSLLWAAAVTWGALWGRWSSLC